MKDQVFTGIEFFNPILCMPSYLRNILNYSNKRKLHLIKYEYKFELHMNIQLN